MRNPTPTSPPQQTAVEVLSRILDALVALDIALDKRLGSIAKGVERLEARQSGARESANA